MTHVKLRFLSLPSPNFYGKYVMKFFSEIFYIVGGEKKYGGGKRNCP
jgi:hypothetical protein